MARSTRPVARRASAPWPPSGAVPVMARCDGPAVMRVSICALVPRRSALAVRFAAGSPRPGPLRSRTPLAVTRTVPTGCALVPVRRASAFTVPSAASEGAATAAMSTGRLRSVAVRSSVAPARPAASSTPWRSPRRRRSSDTPSAKPIRTGASRRTGSCFQSACRLASVSALACTSSVPAAATRASAPWKPGTVAVSFSASAFCGPFAVNRALPPRTVPADTPSSARVPSTTGLVVGSAIVAARVARPIEAVPGRLASRASSVSRAWFASDWSVAVTLPDRSLPITGARSASRVMRSCSLPCGIAPKGAVAAAVVPGGVVPGGAIPLGVVAAVWIVRLPSAWALFHSARSMATCSAPLTGSAATARSSGESSSMPCAVTRPAGAPGRCWASTCAVT